jgi:hypothetical protein
MKKYNELIERYKIGGFIEKIKTHLSEYNGKLILKTSASKYRKSDGEFLETDMLIKCYVDYSSTYWIGVLAHEYAHFLQCIKGNGFWVKFQNAMFENIDDLEDIFTKKPNKIINKTLRKKISRSIINMELDCDKQAIKLINKYKLPVDKKEYIAKANVILYKYLYWAEHGIWPDFLDKKTGKTASYKNIGTTRLLSQDKYKSTNDIPRKLFYIFREN